MEGCGGSSLQSHPGVATVWDWRRALRGFQQEDSHTTDHPGWGTGRGGPTSGSPSLSGEPVPPLSPPASRTPGGNPPRNALQEESSKGKGLMPPAEDGSSGVAGFLSQTAVPTHVPPAAGVDAPVVFLASPASGQTLGAFGYPPTQPPGIGSPSSPPLMPVLSPPPPPPPQERSSGSPPPSVPESALALAPPAQPGGNAPLSQRYPPSAGDTDQRSGPTPDPTSVETPLLTSSSPSPPSSSSMSSSSRSPPSPSESGPQLGTPPRPDTPSGAPNPAPSPRPPDSPSDASPPAPDAVAVPPPPVEPFSGPPPTDAAPAPQPLPAIPPGTVTPVPPSAQDSPPNAPAQGGPSPAPQHCSVQVLNYVFHSGFPRTIQISSNIFNLKMRLHISQQVQPPVWSRPDADVDILNLEADAGTDRKLILILHVPACTAIFGAPMPALVSRQHLKTNANMLNEHLHTVSGELSLEYLRWRDQGLPGTRANTPKRSPGLEMQIYPKNYRNATVTTPWYQQHMLHSSRKSSSLQNCAPQI